MHPRAIEIASRFGVDVWVGSSFEESPEEPGTLITRRPNRMEDLILTGVTAQRGQAKLLIRGYPAGMGSLTALLVALAEAGVSVDMIAEAMDPAGAGQLQVTVLESQLPDGLAVVRSVLAELGGGEVEGHGGLSRIALVGSGMHQRPGVYARAFRALLEQGIEVSAVSTSGISITLWVWADREEVALAALHDVFSLELASGSLGDRSPGPL